MNQDIKLVIDHLDRLLIKGTVNYQLVDSAATMLKTLGNKVAQQEQQIQHLQMALADTEALEAGTAERCERWRGSYKMSQEKVIEQAAVIEKLLERFERIACLGNGDKYDNSIGNCLAIEALTLLIDSKQILADWMREQLGEPVFYQHESGAISTNDIDMNAGKRTALVRLPEYLK